MGIESLLVSSNRNTLHVETAEILRHDAHDAHQYVMRIHAPLIAAAARPGSFVHINCDVALPLRRPMSIMRTDPNAGWIDILYKEHGLGTALLAKREAGEHLDLIGPIGRPFKQTNYRNKPLLIGGGVGIPPMIFLAEYMKDSAFDLTPLVLIGSEAPYPFTPRPSRIIVPGIPPGAIAAMPLLEDWEIASRLASGQEYAGCYQGMVTELAHKWLTSLDARVRAQVEIFACGPTPMLHAVADLAKEFSLPCEISLEEYMACAVGGCAGCTVRIHDNGEDAMKRICVDGPVFEASTVVFS